MITSEQVALAINPGQDTDPDAKASAEKSLRAIVTEGDAELARVCTLMDDADARNGVRERRSADLRGRLIQLRDQDALAPTVVDAPPPKAPKKSTFPSS